MSDATWGDIVREYFPDADDTLVHYLLWERTAYPFCEPEYVRYQLRVLATLPKHLERVHAHTGMGETPQFVARQTGLSLRTVRRHLRDIAAHQDALRREMLPERMAS